jgi:hypothetical protein
MCEYDDVVPEGPPVGGPQQCCLGNATIQGLVVWDRGPSEPTPQAGLAVILEPSVVHFGPSDCDPTKGRCVTPTAADKGQRYRQ